MSASPEDLPRKAREIGSIVNGHCVYSDVR
jgi:hypothetical protein